MPDSPTLRAAGLPCFPCDPRTKAPLVDKGHSWADAAAQPLDRLRISPVHGVPVPPGIIVIDKDSHKGTTKGAIEAICGPLDWDGAIVQLTQNGGEHYAFRAPTWPVKQSNDIAGVKGFDTRVGGKGYICTGEGYKPAGLGILAMATPAMLPVLPDSTRAILGHKAPATPATPRASRPPADDGQVLEALRHINPDCSRADWLRIGLALKSHDPDGGFEVFDAWSRGELTGGEIPANYSEGTQARDWNSFKPEGGVTVGSLFFEASRNGWTPPASFDVAGVLGGQGSTIDDILAHGGDPKETKRLADLAAPDPLLRAVLTRELREAGLLTKDLERSLKPARTAQKGATPAAGSVLPQNAVMSPDMWEPGQTKGNARRPKGTIENFSRMLAAYGVRIRYNEISKEVQLSGPGVPVSGALHAEAALVFIDHISNLNDYPKPDARGFITTLANRNAYNPVRQYVESAAWDGRDHIGALFQCLTLAPSEDAAAVESLFRRWFLGAVAIGTGYTRSFEFVLVLVDPDGGTGKTRFFETLTPKGLHKTSVSLDVSSRDSVKMATGYWLTELGELDGTFTRSEHARLKAFLSSDYDEMRLAYARTYVKHPRRTAFFASVNSTSFLTDSSGNRRYWPVRITAIDYQHAVNVQQAWAQAWQAVQSGHTWHLTPQDNRAVAKRNEDFRARSRVDDGLSVAINPDAERDQHFTASAILARAGIPNFTKSEVNECANWLRKHGYQEVKRSGIRGFVVPAIALGSVVTEFKRPAARA